MSTALIILYTSIACLSLMVFTYQRKLHRRTVEQADAERHRAHELHAQLQESFRDNGILVRQLDSSCPLCTEHKDIS